MKEKTEVGEVQNPFSDDFIKTWDIWKEYRLQTDKFKYKTVRSEQQALKDLVEVSEGNEDAAIRIVNYAISRQWKGFFKLPNNNYVKPRTSIDDVKDAFARRYGTA